jgi:hypothetical protein
VIFSAVTIIGVIGLIDYIAFKEGLFYAVVKKFSHCMMNVCNLLKITKETKKRKS